jgi:hypothetical protein
MSHIDQNDPDIQKFLTLRGLTASALLDMSPIDLHAEIAQAGLEGSLAAKKIVNSTGIDDEVRAWEAGKGQEVVVDIALPEAVEDPFENAFEAIEEMTSEDPSVYEHPTGLPDLVAQAGLGF